MEYLNLYMLTFNCARTPIDVDQFAVHLFDALPKSANNFEPPELIVLYLQEIAPIAYAFLGGSYLTPYFNRFDRAVGQAVAKRWDTNYVNVVTENNGMTGLLVYARSDVTDKVSWIDTAQVGVGFLDMGNKGAVGARLGYMTNELGGGTMDMTFIAAHLAPMEYAFEQRNGDWRSIVERLVFARQRTSRKSIDAGNNSEERRALLRDSTEYTGRDDQLGMFVPTTYLFVGGDLNYRTSNAGPKENDHIRFPRPNTDPTSPTHYSQLLKEDQLIREMKKSRCFQGLSEAPIDFPPTYKYTSPSAGNEEWKWASRRWPSWCDRILYLDTPSWMPGLPGVKPHVYDALPVFSSSDHRPVALSISIPLKSIQVPDDDGELADDVRLAAPFQIDPDWERKRNAARTREVIVGIVAYLGMTWEGNGLLIATTIGILGAWFVLQSFLTV
ncbi:IPPc [Aspergillus sclerotialis]|uniref:IPPc n=1 Tax=Aspergillus sclerotialis TaxID=2070753 RepID=A0A3A2ZXP0_9EURO|nr:IPPc [Aspergillus sclerotialis]